MEYKGIFLKLVLIVLLFVILGVQAVSADTYNATDNTSDMWPVQGSTADKLVIYYRSQQELFTCSQVNGKMEVNRYKLPANTDWVGVAAFNIYLYSEDRVIKKYDLSTGKVQDIVKIADTFARPYSDGKYVYYLKGTQLFAINPQTNKSTAVLTVPNLSGFSTSYSAKNRALIYNTSVVDGYFYYVLSKKQVVGSKTVYGPDILYRIPLKGKLIPQVLLTFPDNNRYRAPGLPYLIKNNILVMANETVMYDLNTKKNIHINNSCLYTRIIGEHVYQKLPDETYQELNIADGTFIPNTVVKDVNYMPYSFGNYTVDAVSGLIRFVNNTTKEKKHFGVMKVRGYTDYELKLVREDAPYEIAYPKEKPAFEKALSVVKELTGPDMNEYDIEKALHDWVIYNTKYDYDTYNEVKITEDSNYWTGLFDNHMAVCAGYAGGFNMLLRLAGIECEYVSGTDALGGAHAWSAVKINGKWYLVDTTWDDTDDSAANERDTYMYFNTQGNMAGHHVPEKWVKLCNSLDDNYFYKNSVVVKSLEELKQALIAKQDNSAIYIRFEGFEPTSEQLDSDEICHIIPGYYLWAHDFIINEFSGVKVYQFNKMKM